MKYIEFKQFDTLCTIVGEEIAKDKICGWFVDASEHGPRSLGFRSILADPRNANIKDRLNVIKGREMFRPVAPIILESEVSNWFDIDIPSPYMLLSAKILPHQKNKVLGIVHKDDTARIQTVNEKQNPKIYKLLNLYYNLTGIPILVNTSFNGCGEPIVETPEDAINTFKQLNLDILVIENFYFKKE